MAGLRVEEGQFDDEKGKLRMADVSGHGILQYRYSIWQVLAAPSWSRCESGMMRPNTNFPSGCTGLQTLCPRT